MILDAIAPHAISLPVAPEVDQKVWLEQRRKGIGGSDAGTVLGINPYQGPFELWLLKTNQIPDPDLSDREAVYWGHTLESIVCDEFGGDRTDPRLGRQRRQVRWPIPERPGCREIHRQGTALGRLGHVQTHIGRDPIDPGPDRRATGEPISATPRTKHGLLDGVLSLRRCSEEAVAVRQKLTTMRLGQFHHLIRREERRTLVAGGIDDRVGMIVGHAINVAKELGRQARAPAPSRPPDEKDLRIPDRSAVNKNRPSSAWSGSNVSPDGRQNTDTP